MRPVLLAAALALALPSTPLAEEGTPVDVEVGRRVVLCKEGLAVCPAGPAFCDDAGIALVEVGPEGPELKGVSPGTTLCSVSGPGGAFRRLLRVTVSPPKKDGEGKSGE